ncbi:MAG: 3TM-type holin [Ignavibacteria bacterium]|nr:3TM-type holin [Ignavibacteria bacterium]
MAIRFLGKLLETVVGVSGKIISELVTDKDLAKQLDHAFRSQVSMEAADFKQIEIEAEKEMFLAQQKTVQAELHQSDLYTKRTRPKIARQSWYITAIYALSSMLLPVAPEAWGLGEPSIDWQIFLVLASPALTYMGVRGFEKWKHGST